MRRKNCMAVVMAALLSFAMPITGVAKEDYNVWISETDLESEGTDLNVEIKTDGKSTDGLLVLSYDASMLYVDEADVVWADDVEMYSVNVVEEGTLKIAYLAEDAIDEGTLATIKFTASGNTITPDMFGVNGDVHDADGNTLTVGIKSTDTPGETNPTEDNKDNTGSTETNKESVETGDEAPLLMYMIIGVGGLLMSGEMLRRKMKHRRV